MEDESIGTHQPPMEATGGGGNRGGEFADYLQACCTARRTGLMTYTSGNESGSVYLQHGQPIHAIAQEIEGEEAVYRMLQWEGGELHFSDNLMPHKSTIGLTWEQLLFEGARRADGMVPDIASVAMSTPSASAHVINSRIQGGEPKLTVICDDLPEASYKIEQEYIHIGRREDNDIILPIGAVSGRHCLIEMRGADVILRDLNSSNGTFVNGEQVSETILQLGDTIQVGPVNLKFESVVKRPKLNPDSTTGTKAKAKAPKVAAPSASSAGGRPKAQPTAPATEPSISRPAAKALTDAELKVKTSVLPDGGEQAKETFSKMKSITYEDLAKPIKERKTKKGRLALIILYLGIVSAASLAVAYFLYFA
ncbi:MAG: FHA domain-containing protein [Verrucomicrobiota bacterium]